MNRVALLIVLVFMSRASWAECSSTGFDYGWPRTWEISRSQVFAIFILTGSEFEYVSKHTTLSLVSKSETVPMKIDGILHGKHGFMQIVAHPSRNLTIGHYYRLYFSNQKTGEVEMHPSHEGWIVKSKVDKDPPVWKRNPRLISKWKSKFPSGEFCNVDFCFEAADESDFLVHAVVKEHATGKKQEFYLVPGNKVFTMGYSICEGTFDFKDGVKYDARFSLIDGAGNESKIVSGTATSFYGPTEKDVYDLEENELKRCNCSNPPSETDMKLFWTTVFALLVIVSVVLAFNSGKAFPKKS